MPKSLAVSPVEATDRPRVVEVWEASVRATHHFLTEDDIAFFKPLVRDRFLDLVELACVRDAAGRVQGFVGVAGGNVEMLFIDPAARGRGLGRALLHHAVHAMQARAVDVNEQNEQAVGFYRRLGFEVVGRSETDALGKPFPLLHLHLPEPSRLDRP
jgi:putative acetyltransferase